MITNNVQSAQSLPPAEVGGVSKDLTNAQESKEMFLQILVAQLRNQNPLDPADPMQFISQLAQFSSLEQTILMRQDLTAIRDALAQTNQQELAAGVPAE
jgi:flagellar basal-body rod modification protein FlgD